jgi:RNA-directed DNA polymerase
MTAKMQAMWHATLNFLGFVHIFARSRKGKFTVNGSAVDSRLNREIRAGGDWCKRHRHDPVKEQQKTLNAKLRGHYQYYGRPTNYRSIWQFYRRVQRIWKEWLGRRTRGKRLTWERFKDILRQLALLAPRITHACSGAIFHLSKRYLIRVKMRISTVLLNLA